MSSIDGKISCDRCGEYHYERSMVFYGTTAMCIGCDDEVEELEEMYGLTKEQGLVVLVLTHRFLTPLFLTPPLLTKTSSSPATSAAP